MNNEQSKKLYRLIESNMEAVAYVTYLTGMVIDEKLFNALPNRLRKSFTDIMPKEIINQTNMSEETQNGVTEEVTPEVTHVENVVAVAAEPSSEASE